MRWIPRIALALALASALLLPLCGLGVRAGLWDWRTGLGLLRWSAYASIAALLLAALALAVPRLRAGQAKLAGAALVVGLCVAAVPVGFIQRARSVPPIHDISTDTENPPAFVALLPLRAGAANPPSYGGPAIAEQQKRAYPDIAPLSFAAPPERAFAAARAAAEAMDWRIVAADPASGRIEATATSLWFGFVDDVVIRVRPAPAGSRVDVRSKSRVGRSDVGANAARIRKFARILQASPG